MRYDGWVPYEEARKGQIISAGSRASPGMPIRVGPGLCQLSRTPSTRRTQNFPSTHSGE